jgi:hypothetical protein
LSGDELCQYPDAAEILVNGVGIDPAIDPTSIR